MEPEFTLTENQQQQLDEIRNQITNLIPLPLLSQQQEDLARYTRYRLYKLVTKGQTPIAADFAHGFANTVLRDIHVRDAFHALIRDFGTKLSSWRLHRESSSDELYSLCRWATQQVLSQLSQ